MNYRQLGRTRLQVSEIGMGCDRLGQESMPDAHWVVLAQRAAELGVTLFDTARAYAGGHSEEILGQAFGDSDDVFIATKVSRDLVTGRKEFSSEYIHVSVETSLSALRRERIDLLQLHSPSLRDLQTYDWAEAMGASRSRARFGCLASRSTMRPAGVGSLRTSWLMCWRRRSTSLSTSWATRSFLWPPSMGWASWFGSPWPVAF
jgi:aryl-alcohol dehydrogenase-like predicted oxidoreductase